MSWVWQGGQYEILTETTGGGSFLAAWAINSNGIASHMKKNVAGQKVGIQMVSATDGSAFTGAVTAYVTGDAGTQAAGSVGAGACTHEGNGFHTYAPAQSETNYDHIGFTFTGSGAVPATLQVYTSFPQTGDSFALIGATGSGLTSLATQASVNTIDDFLDTEIATLITNTSNIETDTQDIQARLPAALVSGRIDASVGAMATDVITSTALAASAVTEIQTGLSTLSAANVSDAVWNAATASYGTAGTYGLLVETNLDAAITSRMATYTQPTGFLAATFPTGTIANTTNITAGTVTTATNVTTVNGLAAGVITAAAIATDAIDSDAIAASAVTEIQSGLATSASIAALNNISSAQVSAAVWDAATASYGGAGSYGLLIETNIDAAISSRLATAGYTAPDNASITTILADTNDIQTRLPAALVGGRIDASVGAMASDVLTAAATAADFTTEIQSGLATSASISALNNLSSADVSAAVWNAATATYGAAGSYGLLVETNLDAAVSSRLATAGYTAPLDAAGTRSAMGLASANLDTQLADIPTVAEFEARTVTSATYATAANLAIVDTVVDSILVDTAEIGAAGAGLTALATAANLATVDTVVDGIKAKTDSLTFTVAGQVDANIQYVNDIQVVGNGEDATPWNPV